MIGRSSFPRLLALAAVPLFSFASEAAAADARWSGDVAYKNRNPAVAWGVEASAQNGFVVWENDRLGLLGRTLDAAGDPTGAVVTLKANDPLPQVPGEGDVRLNKEPALVLDKTGRLFVVWTEELVHIRTDFFFEERVVLGRDVYAQAFDATGAAVGSAVRVHGNPRGFQSRPAVARLSQGRSDLAVVAWDSDAGEGAVEGVFSKVFQLATLAPLTADLAVAAGAARRPAVAASGATALFAWELAGDEQTRGLFARSLAADTLALGKANRLSNNSSTTPSQASLVATQGGFLVAWTNALSATKTRVLVRPLSSTGTPLASQRAVSAVAARAESVPALASRGSQVAVLWMYWGRSLAEGILAVEIDKLGNVTGSEEWLNQQLPTAGYRSALTIAPNGNVIGVWQGPDGSGRWSIRSGKLDN